VGLLQLAACLDGLHTRVMAATAPFKITVCGIDELRMHCRARAGHVVSILDPGWPLPSAFGAYDEHQRLELRFDDLLSTCLVRHPQTGSIFVICWSSVAC
jgi:hypothetical protein